MPRGQRRPAPEPITVDFAGLNDSVGFLLKRAQMAASRDIHRIFGEFDITAVQFSALTVAGNNPGIAQGDLAAALEVERPRMVPVLEKLEGRGLAIRRQDDHDGRCRRIHLTDEGRALLQELQHRFAAQEQRIAATLGETERDRLLEALRTLIKHPG